jgi:hypothetical protein
VSESRDTELNKTGRRSVHLLHFVTAVDEHRRVFSFCCESQPLATVRSFGPPTRCPFCRQGDPIRLQSTIVPCSMDRNARLFQSTGDASSREGSEKA